MKKKIISFSTRLEHRRCQSFPFAYPTGTTGGRRDHLRRFNHPHWRTFTLFQLRLSRVVSSRKRSLHVLDSFLGILPLRSISREWGSLTSIKLPIWLWPYVYKAWARALHSNLEEAALPLEKYASVRDFFVRSLKKGCRPIDPDPRCLVTG